MIDIKVKIIGILSYIIIIAGLIMGEKVSTNATLWNIIKSEFWKIIFIISVGIITEVVVGYYRKNK